jgi:hypothetical protein
LIRKALPLLAAALFASTLGGAHAQTTAPPNAFEKHLEKLDLSVSCVGMYNSTVTGTVVTNLGANNQGQSITEHGSSTLGALIAIHYISKPYVGLEFNYGYARYDENFTGPGIANYFVAPNTPEFQVQSKVNEYSFGYLITPPHLVLGWQPYISAGLGTQAFKPTPLGGQELPEKARMTYYYSLGLQKNYGQHLGLRVGFRELFFLDPDFGQNYLTILKHSTTMEPMAGFYLRY